MALPNHITSLCNAIVLLMEPLVEIVIHDLKSETICFIAGKLSNRQLGDPSLLETTEIEKDIDQIVYPKLNFDGRLIKSISILLEEKWLICINCDVSIFNQMQSLSQQFLSNVQNIKPESLFRKDWQEKIHIAIHTYLKEKNWIFENLTRNQKKDLINHLFNIGAFSEKNAADYMAKALNMGRATIFKYLKERKKNDN